MGEVDNMEMNDSEIDVKSDQLEYIIERSSLENASEDDTERNVEESITESIDEEVDENMLEKILGNVTHDDDENENGNENVDDDREIELENGAEEELAEIYNSEFKIGESYKFAFNGGGEENKEVQKEVPKKGFLIMNEKDDLFSHTNSPLAKTTSLKDLSPEFSNIMNEPNLFKAIRPFKLFKVKSAQTSFFQEF